MPGDGLKQFSDIVQPRVSRFSEDEQVTGAILAALDAQDPGRPSHLYVRDVTNPQAAYWDHKGLKPPDPPKLREAFAFGNLAHSQAGHTFTNLDGFVGTEGVLDGAAVDLAGVRGKSDFRYGPGHMEFKTTSLEIESAEDIWEKLPQDIEQLLFYAALSPHAPLTNHLVYYRKGIEEPIRAFRVEISHIGHVRAALKQRRDNLFNAIDEDAPGSLGRCRYFEGLCAIKDEGLCTCDQLEPLSTHGLENEVQINRDPELETVLQEAWDKGETLREEKLSGWDLETPRRAAGRISGARPREPWTPPPRSDVGKAVFASDLLPGVAEVTPSGMMSTPLRFTPSGFWIKVKRSVGRNVQEKMYPAILKTWSKDYAPDPKYVSSQLLQLAARCAAYRRPTGYLILETEELDTPAKAYSVTFDELQQIRGEIKDRVEAIHQASEAGELEKLPECPNFIPREDCENCLCK